MKHKQLTNVCFTHFSYACSKSGFIFEVDYSKLSLRHVRRLLPIKSKSGKGTKIKNAEDSGKKFMTPKITEKATNL